MSAMNDANPEVPVLYTISDVARILSVSPQHVYRLINTGTLPVVELAPHGAKRSTHRVRSDDLNKFIQSETMT